MRKNFPGSLHNHTDYSNIRLRDSINRYTELIDYAIELGHKAIAITEHDCLSNSVKILKYYKKIKEKNPDFKVILGNEIYLCHDNLTEQTYVKGQDKFFHFILLAKDSIGHQQIREISTRAWMRSFMDKKMRRVPTHYKDLEEIIQKNPGHVIASSACLGGFLPSILLAQKEHPDVNYTSLIGDWIQKIQKIFGRENFYLEMQPPANKDNEQDYINQELYKLANLYSIPYIFTTDSHYLKKEDAGLHKAYLNSQDGDREVDSFYATTYMMSTEELESYFSASPEIDMEKGYTAIEHIINQCEDYSLSKPLKIPRLQWKSAKWVVFESKWESYMPALNKFINSDYDGDKLLAQLIVERLNSDDRLQNKETYEAINECLEMTWESSEVNKTHWSAYFLNLQKIIDECWNAGTIVGPGRGSGVGFILLYILGITQINPLWETTKTFPWRFLNPSRVSVLDVDIDIEGSRRGTVLSHLRKVYGEDRVANVLTLGTEKAKGAILTAARGVGMDVDEARGISAMVPIDRGQPRTLKQCYYGDNEAGYKPVPAFVQAMNENPELWKVAQRIEGLVCRAGIHAGGVIFVDEPFTNTTSLMRAPDGSIIVGLDLHDAEDCSLIKYDLLSVEALDKIHICLDLLRDNGYIDNGSIQERYNQTLNIYSINRDCPQMWQMVWEHKILSLFQMEEESGIKGIATLKPTSVDDLAVLNSTIRLMAQEGIDEMPTDKLARFKADPTAWDKELAMYGLGNREKEILEPVLKASYGLCIAQEQFMELVQLPELGGFSLSWADRLRKSIAKKNPAEFEALTEEFYTITEEKGVNKKFAHYVWEVLISMSKGYGFNQSHTLAYSLIGLQEMNLAYYYPIILWNCACLINDTGNTASNEDDEDDEFDIIPEDEDNEEAIDTKTKKQNTDYEKLARGIGKVKDAGVDVRLVDINKSGFTFSPDIENNIIWCGFKSLLNINDDIAQAIIDNRPYSSPKDFYYRVKPSKQAMISLIKGGAFDTMMNRTELMIWFIWNTCDKKNRLTLQNMSGLIKYGLLPEKTDEQILARRIYEFNRYLKSVCKFNSTYYILDERAINFITEIKCDDYLNYTGDSNVYLSIDQWDKRVYQPWMDVFRKWIAEEKENILTSLNTLIFKEDWDKYAKGSISAWEMEVLCFYYHEHELAHVNKEKYGIVDFNKLPIAPPVDRTFQKAGKTITLYKLSKICGTCIAKNKNKAKVTLLTTSGVVEVKFRKDYFNLFDKQISEKQADGKKKVMEKSWFGRGNMIVVQGIRQGDSFMAKKYASSGGHQLYKIEKLLPNGDLVLTNDRYKGENPNV